MAFFLYPPAALMQQDDLFEKKMFCISQMEKFGYSAIGSFITDSLSCQSTSNPGSPSGQLSTTSISQAPVPKTTFFFSNLVAASTYNSTESPLEEIERYCKERVALSEDFKAIDWWKMNEKCYPRLSKVALQLLSIPASSAAAERVFSLAGNVITEKRNKLGPKSVDSLLFLHSIYKNFNLTE